MSKSDPALGLKLMAKHQMENSAEQALAVIGKRLAAEINALPSADEKLALIARLRQEIDKLESNLAKKRGS
jgi:uncharacterized small protein (DUF1192 family)